MRQPSSNLSGLLPEHQHIPGLVGKGRARHMGPPENCAELLSGGSKPSTKNFTTLAKIPAWVDEWLTPYQKAGLDFSVNREGTLFYWPCGSGKTVVGVLWSLADTGPGTGGFRDTELPKTVVVTRALARRQWQREFQKVSEVRPMLLTGKTPKPIPKDVECVIIGWECLPAWVGALVAWKGFGEMQVIYDEIHRGKNWKRWEKIVGKNGRAHWDYAANISGSAARLATHCVRRLGLSATPAPNTLGDLHSALDLLEPGCWGTGIEWKKRYCNATQNKYGSWEGKGKSNIPELQSRLRWVVNQVKPDIVKAHLPPLRRQLCYLSRVDQGKTTGFKADFKRVAKLGKQALFEMKVLEACARKRPWLIEVIEENVAAGQKVVVFTGRKKDCEELAKLLTTRFKKLNNKKGAPLWWGHGGVSADERDSMVQEYSKYDKGGACLVGTTDAFGEAFDGLQHTDLAIIAFIPWTPGMIEQAEGRFHRHGSDRPVLIMYPVCDDTVDEHIADLLLNKLENLSAALNHTEAQQIADTLAGLEDEDAIINNILAKIGGE